MIKFRLKRSQRNHTFPSAAFTMLTLSFLCTAVAFPQTQATNASKSSNVSSYNQPETTDTEKSTRLQIELLDSKAEQPEPSTTQDSTPVTHKRIKSINERIELLKRLVDNERLSAQQAAEKAAQQAATKPTLTEIAKPIESPDPTSPAADPRPTKQQALEAELREETPSEAQAEFKPSLPIGTVQQLTSGTQVIGGPVDSFELGNSLFLTGNYEAAIKSYKDQLSKSTAPNDKDWISCLIGCCYRMQDKSKEAETIFRTVANSKQGNPYATDYAKWSLTYLDKRMVAKTEYKTIEQEINSILKERNK